MTRKGYPKIAVTQDTNDDPYVLVQPEGTGTMGDQNGSPVMVEVYNGKPRVIIWADINQEDPTHIIELSQSLESNRSLENE
jgi:hypothetical protein